MPRHSARQRDGQSFTRTTKNARRNSAGAEASSRRSPAAVERRRKVIAMKCAEVRKFVRLYLDSELDAKHSFEVEQHLESCAECAGLFEAEKKFDERLGRFLRHGQMTRPLWKKIEALVAPRPVAKAKILLPLAV